MWYRINPQHTPIVGHGNAIAFADEQFKNFYANRPMRVVCSATGELVHHFWPAETPVQSEALDDVVRRNPNLSIVRQTSRH